MEEKRSSGRSKRQKPPDEGSWDCSVCTYRNSQEAYKCEMCDVRKGTSTRKPRVTPQLVAQQVAQQLASPALSPLPTPSTSPIPTLPAPLPPPAVPVPAPAAVPLGPPPMKKEKSSSSSAGKEKKTGTKTKRVPRLRNIDRSTARHMSVTVGTVTVVITDYKPKAPKPQDIPNGVQSDASDTSSSAGTELHEEHAVVNSLEHGTVKHE